MLGGVEVRLLFLAGGDGRETWFPSTVGSRREQPVVPMTDGGLFQ